MTIFSGRMDKLVIWGTGSSKTWKESTKSEQQGETTAQGINVGKQSIPGVSGNGCDQIKDKYGSLVVKRLNCHDRQIRSEKKIRIVQ